MRSSLFGFGHVFLCSIAQHTQSTLHEVEHVYGMISTKSEQFNMRYTRQRKSNALMSDDVAALRMREMKCLDA